MRLTRPIVPLDPGWLFLLAGLTLVFASIVLPPQAKMRDLGASVEVMRSQERLAIARMRAYSDFLTALEAGDETLTRRLAAAHLNLVREGDVPVLVADTGTAPVTDWIEATLPPEPIVVTERTTASSLSTLVTGPNRHWVIAGSIACLFVGLVIGSNPTTPATQTEIEST